MSVDARSSDPSLRLGQQVGRYRLLRLLGQGGTGVVYEAIHARIGQRVAIKVLTAQSPMHMNALQQANHEAWAVSQVRHPGLVRISDSGRLKDGAAYLVMDLLDGESLYDRLQRRAGALLPGDAVHLLRQAASALAAAHAGGVLHLDLKPENLFVCFDPEVPGGARIKLLDFGLAQVRAVRAEGLSGLRAGTPLYMAPEQWVGATLWPQTDVYALGVILFQCLIGRPPFVGSGQATLRSLHASAPVPQLRLARADLPEELAVLLTRMMAKEPQHRPSAGQVAACLQRVHEEMALLATPLPARVAETDDPLSASPTVIEPGAASPQVPDPPAPQDPNVPAQRRNSLPVRPRALPECA